MSRPELELWKEIPDFENYQISNWGRLKFTGLYIDGRVKKGRISKAQSHEVCLRKNNQNFWFRRAQLVLLAFVGPPASDREWNARHLDDCPAHNWPSNLAWGTHKDNHNDGVKNGRHAVRGSSAALRYGAPLRGRNRPQSVKDKISQTKRQFPERQSYGRKHDPKTGRWVS